MPASMMSAPSGGAPYVTGSSMAMVATGPIPGSTPMAVPSSTPIRQKPRLMGVRAAPKPVTRWARRSISTRPDRDPDRDRLAQQIHEQRDGEAAHGQRQRNHFVPAQALRGDSRHHRHGHHRHGE